MKIYKNTIKFFKFTIALFNFLYFFFTYFENEEREWVIVLVCEKKK